MASWGKSPNSCCTCSVWDSSWRHSLAGLAGWAEGKWQPSWRPELLLWQSSISWAGPRSESGHNYESHWTICNSEYFCCHITFTQCYCDTNVTCVHIPYFEIHVQHTIFMWRQLRYWFGTKLIHSIESLTFLKIIRERTNKINTIQAYINQF